MNKDFGKMTASTTRSFEVKPSMSPEVSDDPSPTRRVDYAEYVSEGKGLESVASINRDGRISVTFDMKKAWPDIPHDHAEIVEEFAVDSKWKQYPMTSMNIVIMIVGSRGDVQPYVALGQQLKKDGHRVRLATHETFKTFVCDAGLDFFNIGGNPQDLMSYMVKNPGLIPGYESLTNGDIGKKRKMLAEILDGCWRSCHSPCPSTGRVFIADAIISNPPAFAHIHCAEALGIPLLASFTMPWSPTTAFPHPLVNITMSNIGGRLSNYLSYAASEILQWQGIGDIINKFRTSTLGLSELTLRSGPGLLDKLKVPWTYCMSPALVPKPRDWKNHIDVVGFYFLDLAASYTPSDDLIAFLKAGDPPIYIGFGSVVVDDPAALTQIIFNATKEAGVRALVSAGWGGLGGTAVPSHVFMLGNIPHDWLFDNERVAAVVHHGGAGTTAIGLAKGRPTVVVPFFGDQGFWGSMIHKAGAGPEPIDHKDLKVENLSEAIKFAMSPQAKEAAQKLANKIREENGVRRGVDSFYKHLPLLNMRCNLDPSRLGVWWSMQHCLKLSAFAAQVLLDAKLINIQTLVLHRSKEYVVPKTSSSLYESANSAFWNITHYIMLDDRFSHWKRKGDEGISLLKAGISWLRSVSPPEDPKHMRPNEIERAPPPTVKSESSSQSDKIPQTVRQEGKNTGTLATKRSTVLDLVTLPFHGSRKSLHSRSASAEAKDHQIRLARIEEGKIAVEKSTPDERARIIKCFEDEKCQTPARMQMHQTAVDHARTETMTVDDDIGDVDARFARDMQMAMKLSLEGQAPIDGEQ